MLTLKAVNKAMVARGYSDELVKGDGYFYFIGEKADQFYSSSVYVYRLNQLTLEQWLDDYARMLAEYEAK